MHCYRTFLDGVDFECYLHRLYIKFLYPPCWLMLLIRLSCHGHDLPQNYDIMHLEKQLCFCFFNSLQFMSPCRITYRCFSKSGLSVFNRQTKGSLLCTFINLQSFKMIKPIILSPTHLFLKNGCILIGV